MQAPAANRWKDAAGYAAVVLICAAIFVWLFAKSGVRLHAPSVMSRDYLFTLFQVQSMLETGSYYHHDRVGMPYGSNLLDFPMAEAWHFGSMKLWAALFQLDAIQTLNLHLLLSFPLAALTGYFALRQLGCGRVNALVLAQLYAFLYYHVERLGHCFLVSYYFVPLVTLVLLRLGRDPGVLVRRDAATGRLRLDVSVPALGSAALCLAVGSAGIYYAFFACFFFTVVGLIALAAGRWHVVLASVLFIALIVAAGLVNVWPCIEHFRREGVNPEIDRTSIGMVERYGLKLVAMVVPTPDHPLPAFRQLRARYDGHAGWDDVSHISLGTFGVVGFLLLVVPLFAPRPSDRPPGDDRALAILNLAAILLAATSAAGVVFALLVTPSIRGYERMIVFIAFFSFAALGLAWERWANRWATTGRRRIILSALMLAALPLAIREQVHPGLVRLGRFPGYADFDAIKQSVEEIERLMPPGATIAQLPHHPFPEGGDQHALQDYQQIVGPLFSKRLRWSGAACKARLADEWQKAVMNQNPAEMLDRLVHAGFDGLSLDRCGYADKGARLESELTQRLGAAPRTGGGDRYAFYDLRAYRERLEAGLSEEPLRQARSAALDLPPRLSFEGFRADSVNGATWHWANRSNAALHIVVRSPEPRTIRLVMRLTAAPGNRGAVHISMPKGSETVPLDATTETDVRFEETLRPGIHTIRFHTALPGYAESPTTKLFFRMVDVHIE